LKVAPPLIRKSSEGVMSKSDNLTRQEMVRIFEMHDSGKSNRKIGKIICRCHKAVGAVLNESRYYRRLTKWEKLSSFERARFVLEIREKRQKQSRKREWLKSRELREHVIGCLCKKRMSPEMIAETVGEHFPEMTLTAKAIYNFTKKARIDLQEYLPEKGIDRRQRVANRRSRFQEGAPPKNSIETRPAAVESREEVGHYEADTIHSRKGSKAAVLTIIERVTRQKWYFSLPNLEANTVLPVLLVFFQAIPEHLRKTLTLDNGSEWSEAYHKLEKVIPGFKVYFCHPYKAWQRGAVENANRQLRRFFPKGTDFSQVTKEQLRRAEILINNWPMKCLGWRSASKIYEEALKLAA
jgi:transposase, IS30 family